MNPTARVISALVRICLRNTADAGGTDIYEALRVSREWTGGGSVRCDRVPTRYDIVMYVCYLLLRGVVVRFFLEANSFVLGFGMVFAVAA